MKESKENKIFTYKGLKIEIHPEVYNPAEDTFLLLDSIKIEENYTVLEIGTGCGIIALECARVGANVLCTDISKKAIDSTKHNFQNNRTNIKGIFKVRHGDLFSVLKKDEKFDIIIFNPPYVPTKNHEIIKGSEWLDIATSGGRDGLETTVRYIQGLNDHLKDNGKAYFIFSTLSDRKKLETILNKSGFEFKNKKSQNFLGETIDVYELKKKIMKE